MPDLEKCSKFETSCQDHDSKNFLKQLGKILTRSYQYMQRISLSIICSVLDKILTHRKTIFAVDTIKKTFFESNLRLKIGTKCINNSCGHSTLFIEKCFKSTMNGENWSSKIPTLARCWGRKGPVQPKPPLTVVQPPPPIATARRLFESNSTDVSRLYFIL